MSNYPSNTSNTGSYKNSGARSSGARGNSQLPMMQPPDAQLTGDNIYSTKTAFELAYQMSSAFAKSTLIPKEYQNNPANCLIALEMANRVGLSPLMVMQNLYIVNGRPSWSSQFIIAMINRSGKYKTELQYEMRGSGDAQECYAYATDHDGRRVTGPAVSIKMARAEGWLDRNGSKWKSMPEVMMRYRAASFFGRLNCPDLVMGIYSEDEVIDMPTGSYRRVDDGAAPLAAEAPPAYNGVYPAQAAGADPWEAVKPPQVAMQPPPVPGASETARPGEAAEAAAGPPVTQPGEQPPFDQQPIDLQPVEQQPIDLQHTESQRPPQQPPQKPAHPLPRPPRAEPGGAADYAQYAFGDEAPAEGAGPQSAIGAASGNGGVFACAGCGQVITKTVHAYSRAKFGRPLCRDCQDAAKES